MLADLPSDGHSQAWPVGCNSAELYIIAQGTAFEERRKGDLHYFPNAEALTLSPEALPLPAEVFTASRF